MKRGAKKIHYRDNYCACDSAEVCALAHFKTPKRFNSFHRLGNPKNDVFRCRLRPSGSEKVADLKDKNFEV